MDAGRSGRLRMAGAVLALGFLSVTALSLGARSAGAGEPAPALLPDLFVPKPAELFVDSGKRTILRFSHTTANLGKGPLEISPDLTRDNCSGNGDDNYYAHQYVYRDTNGTGEFERGDDQAPEKRDVGCMFFHEPHNHYHFQDFALYELYRERTGNLAATSDKVSFCVFDLQRMPGLPGSDPFYFGSNCDRSDGTHGISVGWADVYGAFTPGQELDVTGKRRGRYCLLARADPEDRLDEVAGGNTNNVLRLRIALRPRKGFVKRLDGPCKSV
jgi:Lysyl oxidase